MTISELIQSITNKIAQISQLLSDIAEVNAIKAERDEAKAGLEAIEAQLNQVLPQ